MKVKDILAFFGIKNNDNKEIYCVTDKSYYPKKNWIYFNLSSFENAKKYIHEAKDNGAYLVLSKHLIDKAIYIENLEQKINAFLVFFYKFKRKFNLIGITGTNGKSSLSNFLKQSLRMLDYNAKNIVTNKENYSYLSKNTTPSSFELMNIFKSANKQKIDYLIMEVSSIGIKEGRVNDITFDYLFLTNLEKDHLDYHHSIEEYHQTKIDFLNKQKSIKFIPNNYIDKVKSKHIIEYKIVFAKSKYDLIIENKYIDNVLFFKTNLVNLAYIYFFLKHLKVNLLLRLNILKRIKTFKGRNDVVNQNPLIVIDYAHTASSFENILSECSLLFHRKMIIVFGAGGNREFDKREEYAKICNKYNSYAIVTNDNPRTEDPKTIALDICKHLNHYEIELDRKKAIKRAFEIYNDQSMIVILGKGNESYITYKDYLEYHNDYDEVEKCIKNRM